jgi:hypothetical protein
MGGLAIVKSTTPSFALCKYFYIYVFCLTLCTAGSTISKPNKTYWSTSLASLLGWSSLSRVARGTTRGSTTGTCCIGLTCAPSSLSWPPTNYCSSHIVEQWRPATQGRLNTFQGQSLGSQQQQQHHEHEISAGTLLNTTCTTPCTTSLECPTHHPPVWPRQWRRQVCEGVKPGRASSLWGLQACEGVNLWGRQDREGGKSVRAVSLWGGGGETWSEGGIILFVSIDMISTLKQLNQTP